MPRVRITRRLHFSAAHRLARPEWSDDRNSRVFGDCANANWHGHNYELDVTVSGPVDAETGYVMDLKDLKELVNRHVVDDLDHRNLNLDVPWLQRDHSIHREPRGDDLGADRTAHPAAGEAGPADPAGDAAPLGGVLR